MIKLIGRLFGVDIKDFECPVCGGIEKWWKPSSHASDWKITWSLSCGHGTAVCKGCAKNRTKEIKEHNKLYHTPRGSKKDPNCDHEWSHLEPSRWYCTKCGATYQWMCGCGGSCFVCRKHYDDFISDAIEKYGSVEEFLKEESF